jgi:hypothetical protein
VSLGSRAPYDPAPLFREDRLSSFGSEGSSSFAASVAAPANASIAESVTSFVAPDMILASDLVPFFIPPFPAKTAAAAAAPEMSAAATAWRTRGEESDSFIQLKVCPTGLEELLELFLVLADADGLLRARFLAVLLDFGCFIFVLPTPWAGRRTPAAASYNSLAPSRLQRTVPSRATTALAAVDWRQGSVATGLFALRRSLGDSKQLVRASACRNAMTGLACSAS